MLTGGWQWKKPQFDAILDLTCVLRATISQQKEANRWLAT